MPLVRSLEYGRPLVIRHAGHTLAVRRIANSDDGEWRFLFFSTAPDAFRAGGVALSPSTIAAVRIPGRVRVDHAGRCINLYFYKKRDCSKPRVSIDTDQSWHVVPRELVPPLSGRAPYRRPLAG